MKGNLSETEIDKILMFRPRVEKLISKDVKIRTFITNDSERDDGLKAKDLCQVQFKFRGYTEIKD